MSSNKAKHKPFIRRESGAVAQAAGDTHSSTKRLRSASSMLALEPRMLFDGAAAATVDPVDAHHQTIDQAAASEMSTPPATPAPEVAPASTGKTLLVIDGAVKDAQQLAAGILHDTEVLIVDTSRDGLAQIEQTLARTGPVDAIHILSHGEPGEVRLGSTQLSNANLAQFERELSAIGASITRDGDVLLYGCDVSAGSAGAAFIEALSRATSADVAASNNATGSTAAGGDWVLESHVGLIQGALPLNAATISGFTGLLAPAPQVTLSASQQVLLGQSFSFTATFENTGPDAGYGPYLDFFVRSGGADGAPSPDGITITSATYLGRSLTLTAIPLVDVDTGTAGIQVNHPYFLSGAGANANRITAPAGFTAADTLYVVQLPFGSVTAGSPALPITLNGTLSNLADVGTPLNVTARAGFQFGQTPLNDPATDPSVVQSGTVTTSITPALYRVTTTYNGAESETATGPNYERQVIVDVDIANGQTITNLDLTGLLPTNAQFVRVETGSGNTTAGGTATSTPSTSAPGGTLTYRLASVAGTGAASDARLVYTFYVPERDASNNVIINAASGDDVAVNFNTRVQGSWTPLDARDSATTIDDNPAGAELTITAKSIAVQKSATLIELGGATGVTPGDRYNYQLDGQVSDFFAFGGAAGSTDLLVIDELSDGQNFLTATTSPAATNPTLSVTRNGATQNYTFQAGEFSSAVNGTGSTTITFNVRAVLARVGAAQTLEGDQFDRTGVPDNTRDEGVTTFRINFIAEVREDYRVNPPGGTGTQLTLNENDLLRNDVTVQGLVLDGDLDPSKGGLQSEADTSSVQSTVQQSALLLNIVGLNGSSVGGNPVVRPGDDVTYRLRYTVPTGDYENFRMSAFLPLPILRVGDPDANGAAGPSFTQAAFAGFPSLSQFSVNAVSNGNTIALSPTASVSAGANSISFDFGNRDDATNEPLQIDVFFTLKVTDEPFVDRLFLSSLGQSDGQNTATSGASSQEIGQLQFAQPVLGITKGYVADNVVEATSVFDPAYTGSPNPTTLVRAAGDTSANPLLANITSTNGNRNALNSNISNIDAGDTIRAALVIENTGSSDRGAFDVTVRDTLTPGFSLAATPNLRLAYGNGTAIALSSITDTSGAAFADEAAALAALFGTGIRFVDPASTQGAIGVGRDAGTGAVTSDGSNIIVVTYDVTANAAVQARQVLSSAPATLTNYASIEGGTNFAPSGGVADDASATIAAAAVAKSIVATGQSDAVTSGTNVVIGETVQYEVVIRLPEGVTNNTSFAFRDVLDAGLGLVSVDSVATSGVTLSGGAITDPNTDGRIVINGARTQLDINFGSITNSNSDNATAETITVRYTAVVLNVAGNQGEAPTPTQLNNAVGWDGQANRASAPNVTVVEPALTVTVTPSATQIDADDTVTYTVVITSNGGAPAQEVDLASIPIPAGLTYVAGSFTNTAGVAPTTINSTTRSATFSSLNPAQSSTFTFQATVDTNVSLGQSFVVNATTTFTSTPGTPGDLIPSLSTDVERTGAGGVDNYSVTGASTINVLPAQPQMRIVATSETSSGGSGTLSADNVAVGEIIRYRAVVELPESASTGFQIRPALPAGIVMTNSSAVSVAFISNNAMTLPGDLAGAQITGSSVVAPNFVLPSGRISGAGTSSPVFDLGDITNLDSDTDTEYVVIEFNAIVQNVSGNQDGTAGNANFVVRTGGVDRATSNNVAMTVDEPTVTIDKRVVGVSGSVATYEVVVTNTGTSGTPTAFDLQITDDFVGAVNQTFNGAGGVTVVSEPSPGAVTNTSDADTLSATLTSLAPGQSVTLRYTATVTDPVLTVPTRNAEARYTGLSASGETLSVTIGGSPVTTTSTAERTGADGVLGSGALNDYRVQDADAPALIRGRVWNEIVADGAVTGSEPLISGLTVTIRSAGADNTFNTSDDVVTAAVTDSSGNYSAVAGSGLTRVTVPSPITGGTFNGFTSTYDTDGGTANQTQFTASAGSTVSNINFGYAGPNSAPSIVALDPTRSGNYTENGTAIQIDNNVTVADTQLDVIGNYNGATLNIARLGGANPQDVFGVSGAVTISAGNVLVSGVAIGTVTNSGGTLAITFNNNATQARVETALRSITYANSSDDPPASVTLRYTLNDGNAAVGGAQGSGGPLSTTSDIVINITAVNDNPVANNDTNSVTENSVTPVTGNVITTGPGADSDVDNPIGALQVQGVAAGALAGPLTGNVGTAFAGTYGTLTLNADGSYSYTLDNANPTVNALASGQSINDVYTYTINDGAGGTATARLTITINGANDAPLGGDRNVTTPEDIAFTFAPGNFALNDPDTGATLSGVRIDSLPALGTLTLSGGPVSAGQVLSTAQLSALVYTPPLNQNGAAFTTFTFSVRDDQNVFNATPSTMTINVTPVNDPPVAAPDTNTIVQGGTAVGGNVITGPGTDTDVDNTAAQLSVAGVQAGTVAGPLSSGAGSPIASGLGYGTLQVNADGTYVYTLNNASPAVLALTPGQSLNDVYSYTVRDPSGGTSTTTVTITINGINNPPAGTDRTLSAIEDTPLTIQPSDFGFTDVDTGDALKDVRIDTLPASGTLLLNGAPISVGQIITVADLTAGRLTYAPAAHANRDTGTAPTFTFSVRDQGDLFDLAPNTITIDIAPVNDPPVAISGPPVSATPGVSTPINPPAPTDLESPTPDLTVTITQLPIPGSGVIRLADGTPVSLGQTLTASQFAGLVFVADPTFNGTLLSDGSFDAGRLSWVASDPQGLQSSAAGVDLHIASIPIQPPTSTPAPSLALPPVLDLLGSNSGSTGQIAGGVVPLFGNSPVSAVSITPLMSYLNGEPLYFDDPRVPPSDLRLPIPFSPIVFVTTQVRESQDAREFFDVVSGGARAGMLLPYIGGPGAGRGLGMTPGLFVTHAVAESREYRELDALRAETIRDPLLLDGGGLVEYWLMGPEDMIGEPINLESRAPQNANEASAPRNANETSEPQNANETPEDASLTPQQYQGDGDAQEVRDEDIVSKAEPLEPKATFAANDLANAAPTRTAIVKRAALGIDIRGGSENAHAESFSELLRNARHKSGDASAQGTTSTWIQRDGHPHA